MPVSCTHLRIVMLVNSVPLTETFFFGAPRSAMMQSSSLTTRFQGGDVFATNTRFSRRKSSTTARIRKRPRLSAHRFRNSSSSAGADHLVIPWASVCPKHAFCRLCATPAASLHGRSASFSCGLPLSPIRNSHVDAAAAKPSPFSRNAFDYISQFGIITTIS